MTQLKSRKTIRLKNYDYSSNGYYFITICSRNDSKMIETAFEALDENIFPLKNQVDYIIANNNDKSENIKIIANQLSILPRSIVFIDDNQIIRDD